MEQESGNHFYQPIHEENAAVPWSDHLASPVTRPLLLDQVQPWWRAGERDLPAGAGWWGAGGLLRPALVQQTQARASEHHHQVAKNKPIHLTFSIKKYDFWRYLLKAVSPQKSITTKKYRL